MKIVTGLLAAVLLLAGVASSHAIVRIAGDAPGLVPGYWYLVHDPRTWEPPTEETPEYKKADFKAAMDAAGIPVRRTAEVAA